MCFGGGGGDGGDGGAAAERARQAKEARQRRQAIARINARFDAPKQQRARLAFGEDVYGLNKAELDEEQENRDRARRFQLARQGLTAGSQDAFTRGELAEDYEEGLTGIRRHADERVLDLRSADERSRSNLVSQAQAGLDPTTAAQLALNAASTNLELARTQDVYADLGQFMKALSLGTASNAESAGRRRARSIYDDDPYGIFTPRDSGGTVTSIG